MDISFETINENMDEILKEFKHNFLEERNYAACEKILKDIFNIFSLNGEIQLDVHEGYDNNFHELYSKIKDIIDSREDKTRSKSFTKMNKTFEEITKYVFKTAEVRKELSERDITNDIYLKALKNGVIEATKAQKPYLERIEQLQKLNKDFVGKENLVNSINESQHSIVYIKDIIEKYKNIEDLKKEIDELDSGDIVQIEEYNNEIAEIYSEIKNEANKLNTFNHVGLDIDKMMNDTTSSSKTYLNKVVSGLEKDKIIGFTTILNNMIKAKKDGDRFELFKDVDIDKFDPSNLKDQKQIFAILRKIELLENKNELQIEFYQRQVDIYEHQIELVQEESKIADEVENISIPDDPKLPDDIEEAKKDDLEYYSKMVRAQMYGDKEMKNKYDKYFKLFFSSITGREIELKDIDGNPVMGDDGVTPKTTRITTVDYEKLQRLLDKAKSNPKDKTQYPDSYEEILKFLQLEKYKEKIEFNCRIRSKDLSVLRELKDFDKVLDAKTPEDKAREITALEAKANKMLEENEKYLSTYHNSVNEVKMRIKHHSTAGKYGETRLPIIPLSQADNFLEKMKYVGHNIKAFSRVRSLKEVDGFFKKSLLVATNALNITTMIPRAVVTFAGDTISNEMKLYHKDKAYKHEAIVPNPYKGRKDARREARVDYYRENGNNRFVSRLKGWTDDYVPFIFTNRRRETENNIIDRQIDEIKKNIDGNYTQAQKAPQREAIKKQKEAFLEEIKVSRIEDFRKMAASKEVAEDIFKDTDSARSADISERIIQRLALEYEGMDSSFLEHTGSYTGVLNTRRKGIFTKEDETYEERRTIKKPEILTEPIEYTRPKISEYGVINADPIGIALRSNAIKNTLTRLYTIPYLAMLSAQNIAVKKCVSVIVDSITPPVPEEVVPEITTPDPTIPDPDVPEVKFDPHTENLADDVTLSDLHSGDRAYYDYRGASSNPTVTWKQAPDASNLQAIAFDVRIPETGWSKELYDQLQSIGIDPGDRLYYTLADGPTHKACQIAGKSYAGHYLDGTFDVTGDTLVTDLIKEHTPDQYDQALDMILNSPEMAGEKGIKFLNDSFQAAYGKTNVIQSGKGWGTGWDVDAVIDFNEVASKAKAKAALNGEIIDQVGEDLILPKKVEEIVNPSTLAKMQPSITTTQQKHIKVLETVADNKIVSLIRKIRQMGALYELTRKNMAHKTESDREKYEGPEI